MQLGVSSVLFGGHDLRTAFQHIKWAGYDGIEISALDGFGAFGDRWGSISIWRPGTMTRQ